jgi:hypothetical protein
VAVAALLVVAALLAAAWSGQAEKREGAHDGRARPLLLFTTLPIYWAEAPDLAATLNDAGQPHWARRAIEEHRELRPIDALGAATLAGARDLLMAQPRPLSPDENVELDGWVAEGGHLLLFADPALTAASAFALGDRRRPQDIVLLSPILARWGLRLEFDAEQPAGEHTAALGDGVAIPVDLPGRFVTVAGGRADSLCRLSALALVAECRVGNGKVFAIADAALFESEAGKPALDWLLTRAFERTAQADIPRIGEIAGRIRVDSR